MLRGKGAKQTRGLLVRLTELFVYIVQAEGVYVCNKL